MTDGDKKFANYIPENWPAFFAAICRGRDTKTGDGNRLSQDSPLSARIYSGKEALHSFEAHFGKFFDGPLTIYLQTGIFQRKLEGHLAMNGGKFPA